MSEKKPTGKKKLRPDINEVAHRVMREATGQAPKTKPPEEEEPEVATESTYDDFSPDFPADEDLPF